jgi:hypothetical protein
VFYVQWFIFIDVWEERKNTSPMNNKNSQSKETTNCITSGIKNESKKIECADIPKNWKRSCPMCRKEIYHTRKSVRDSSEKDGKLCFSCVAVRRNKTEGYTNPFSVMKFFRTGISNGMYGKAHKDIAKKKMKEKASGRWTLEWFTSRYGEEKGTELYNKKRKQSSVANIGNSRGLGYKHTEEQKTKFRIARQIHPAAFNLKGCYFIDEYNKSNGYNFIHALNGGERKFIGYSVDGYDAEKNVVFEYDERKHFDIEGNLRKKDIERMDRIKKHLGCRFIRYNEVTKTITEY